MRYNFITIEGNIGSGKTSLATMLAHHYNGKLILEQFDNNPFLPEFYKSPERRAFPLELFFLAERYQQMQHLTKQPELFTTCTITDYIFEKSRLFAGVNLNSEEKKLYQRLYDWLKPSLPQPELLVFLHKPVEQLVEQIAKRGREYEQMIHPEYLMKIQNAYLIYLKSPLPFPVVILDSSQLDFVARKDDFEVILQILNEPYEPGLHYVFPDTFKSVSN